MFVMCKDRTPRHNETAMRIAVLLHRNERNLRIERYYVTHLSRLWAEDGHDVMMLFGTETHVPADVVVVHVNLSVVPDAYLEFARRYPLAINGRVRDIRKSTISSNLLGRDDRYNGQVIVKSNLNYAGRPERTLRGGIADSSLGRRFARLRMRLTKQFRPGEQQDYRVYPSLQDVPRRYFSDSGLVVERFLPERDGEFHVVHTAHFLGERIAGTRLWSRESVVTQENVAGSEREDPHPEILRQCKTMGFDYGKFDYVIHDGSPVLIDANKTPGAGETTDPGKLERRRFMAEGLYTITARDQKRDLGDNCSD